MAAAARSRWLAGSRSNRLGRRPAGASRGVPHRLEEVVAPRGRAVRQRLQGHQRSSPRSRRWSRSRRDRARDPRRSGEGGDYDALARPSRRRLRRLSDRRVGRRDPAALGDGVTLSRPATWARGRRRPRRRPPRRCRPAFARLRLLRPVPRLRGAGRSLPRAGRGGDGWRAPARASIAGPCPAAAPAAPLEHRILLTATFCLLARGAVMVYSASSARALLAGHGGGTSTWSTCLRRVGLLAMHLLAAPAGAGPPGHPADPGRWLRPLVVVLIPGWEWSQRRPALAGRRLAEFQPSELIKLALVLYVAAVLGAQPRLARNLRGVLGPVVGVGGSAVLLILVQPDLGTALVICFTLAAHARGGRAAVAPARPRRGRRRGPRAPLRASCAEAHESG